MWMKIQIQIKVELGNEQPANPPAKIPQIWQAIVNHFSDNGSNLDSDLHDL